MSCLTVKLEDLFDPVLRNVTRINVLFYGQIIQAKKMFLSSIYLFHGGKTRGVGEFSLTSVPTISFKATLRKCYFLCTTIALNPLTHKLKQAILDKQEGRDHIGRDRREKFEQKHTHFMAEKRKVQVE